MANKFLSIKNQQRFLEKGHPSISIHFSHKKFSYYYTKSTI